MQKWRIIFIVFLLAVPLSCAEPARTSDSILFQGYLTDNAGRPYFGTVAMGFKFYDTIDGVKELYNGVESPRKVAVYNGQYATKFKFTPAAFKALNSVLNAGGDVWVEVYSERDKTKMSWQASGYAPPDSTTHLNTTANMLLPRVQLNAVTYALAVRGLYYQAIGDSKAEINTLKIGQKFQAVTPVNAKNGLVVSGNVALGTFSKSGDDTVATGNLAAAKLVVNGNMLSSGTMRVSGDIKVLDKVGSDSYATAAGQGVFGAVWN
ncbi:MAG: hypothetical protein LBQ83_07435 [Candidatus Margulisbacteria bacterium]|jgi:hypothetical protein|nr:hypothetical protein [Candidatus Margulisiibacteriota bacterium]